MTPKTQDEFFTPHEIRELFQDMGMEFARRGQVGEIAVHNGKSMVTSFSDDANAPALVAIKGGKADMTAIADIVGARHGLEQGWLREAVSMLSTHPEIGGDFPNAGPAGLRIFEASPKYIRFMKMEVQNTLALEQDNADDYAPMKMGGR